MVKTLTTEEVKGKIDNKEKFYLIDVLAKNSFEGRHLPGATNVPYSTSFVEDFEKEVSVPKNADLVVYCASSGCQLSVLAADALGEAGYTNVSHYVDGLAGWMQAKYKFEE